MLHGNIYYCSINNVSVFNLPTYVHIYFIFVQKRFVKNVHIWASIPFFFVTSCLSISSGRSLKQDKFIHAHRSYMPRLRAVLTQTLVYICPHSPIHWICFEKCANTHLKTVSHWDVCLHTLRTNPMGRRVRAYALKGKINLPLLYYTVY